jgi:hypothetical protein
MDEFASPDELEEDEIEQGDYMELKRVLGSSYADLLFENGYASVEDADAAPDSQLLAIRGIGEATLGEIRELIAQYMLEGVSVEDATPLTEVKPSTTDAEAAEGEIADAPSAVEASVAEDAAPVGATAVRSLFPSALKLAAPSGLVYEWPKAGSQVNVAADDLAFVMGKNRSTGRACCGGSGGRHYFELA